MPDSINALDLQNRSLQTLGATATPPPNITVDANPREVDYIEYKDSNGAVQTLKIPTYSFNGMSGLSLTQVAIMVTMNRANQVENEIINSMEKIAEINKKLEVANQAADILSNVGIDETIDPSHSDYSVTYHDGFEPDGDPIEQTISLRNAIKMIIGENVSNELWDYDTCIMYYNKLTREMDSMNSLNQENMINLQSFVNKRDQAYELGSNIDKLMFSGYMTVARSI